MSLDPIYQALGYLLAIFYLPFHSLGVATILLTVVIMLIQFPLTAKQARSMIQMQRVQPEIKKIQQKYKDDKAKQNEELLKFYQENKINPLAGCLPMVVTIPIGIAVFRTFSLGVQRHLPESGKLGTLYHDICGKTNVKTCTAFLDKTEHQPAALRFLGMSLNETAREAMKISFWTALPYLVLVALVVITGWYQVRQTQARQLQTGGAACNAQMQAMTKVFPVIFGLITLGLNAGATLYFVVSNAWRIGQQHLVIGKMYEQAVAAGDLKPKTPPPGNDAGGNGKRAADADDGAKPPPDTKHADPKGPVAKNGDANGEAGAPGLSSGARRKKAEAVTVEWIEVSARTLADARELALDRLGVIADDLEYEVIDEPKGGLFGLGRTDARIRARVKPLSREKPPDRRRRRTSDRRPGGAGRKPRKQSAATPGGDDGGSPAASGRSESGQRSGGSGESERTSPSRSRRRGRGRGAGSGAESLSGNPSSERPANQGREDRPEAKADVDTETEDVDIEEQAVHAATFARGLVEAMGLEGSVKSRVDDDTVLVEIDGEGLGILVGPRGSTLQAVEELVRAVVQHGLSGRSARLRVDVGGYRERRREALAAFARQVAEEVRSTNLERALEPMNPPDRKVVHDAVAEIDGVETSSEGEEPRRRVVITPA